MAQQKKQTESNSGFYALILLLLVLLGIGLFTPYKIIESTLKSEQEQIIDYGGTETNEWLLSQSMPFVKDLATKLRSSAENSSSSQVDAWLMERIDVSLIWINLFGYRLFVAVMWMLLCMPLLTSAIIDGFYTREINKDSFISQSPIKHKVGVKLTHYLLIAVVIWLIIPLPIPSWIIPCIMSVKSITSWFLICNLQKRLYK